MIGIAGIFSLIHSGSNQRPQNREHEKQRYHTLYSAYQALGETGIDEVSYETENGTATLSIPVEEKRVFYGRKVLDNASTCEFEENQRYLTKFADEVE